MPSKYRLKIRLPKDELSSLKILASLNERLRRIFNDSHSPQRKHKLLKKLLFVDSIYARRRFLLAQKQPPSNDYGYVPFDYYSFIDTDKANRLIDSLDESVVEEELSLSSEIDDPLENFLTYTEVDPNNRISVAQNTISGTYYCNEASYVYKDYGVDYFGPSFQHRFEVRIIGGSIEYPHYATVWAVSNSIGHGGNTLGGWLYPPLAQAVGCFFYRNSSTDNRLYIRDYENGLSDQDYISIRSGVLYYATVTRNGGTVSVSLFSDPERTILVGTKSVTSNRNFRYIFAVQSHNANRARYISTVFQNLDLGTSETSVKPWIWTETSTFLE